MNQAHPNTAAKEDFAILIRQFFTYEPRAWRALVVCVLAIVCTTIDPPYFSLTSVEVQSFLRGAESQAPLIVAVMFLALAVITLIGGTAGDLYGRQRMLVIGLVGILISNALNIFAVGTPLHHIVHLLHVASSAFVMPMTIAILTLAFAPTMRPFAFGMLFGFRSVALLLGSALKLIGEQSGVLWLAYVPVVVLSAVSIWLVARHAPESSAKQEIRSASAILNLASLAIVFLIAFFIIGGVSLLQNWLLVLIALGTLALSGVTARWWILRLKYFLDWDVFTNRDIVLAIIAGMMTSGVQGAFLFEFWTYNTEIQGFGGFVASLRTVPYMLGVVAGSFMIAQIARRWGARRTLAIGMGLMAIGLMCMALVRGDTPGWLMMGPVFVIGYGFGIATPVRAQVVLSAPPANLVGSSAAVNTATGQLGYALGITTSSVIVMQIADATFLRTLQQSGVSQDIIDEVSLGLPDFATRAAGAHYALLPQGMEEFAAFGYASAWTDGMTQMFLIFGIAMLIGAVMVYVAMSRENRAPAVVTVPDSG